MLPLQPAVAASGRLAVSLKMFVFEIRNTCVISDSQAAGVTAVLLAKQDTRLTALEDGYRAKKWSGYVHMIRWLLQVPNLNPMHHNFCRVCCQKIGEGVEICSP